MNTKISDLAIDELKGLISKTVQEVKLRIIHEVATGV
jgi:hypothetical protein